MTFFGKKLDIKSRSLVMTDENDYGEDLLGQCSLDSKEAFACIIYFAVYI